ncbi:ionotropic receptor 25a-like [Mercenaria mercenaria]|uniref:ionotropic receptor 25a-like n=1 Tax=Mercenaria mercenaria TaxID=6596 RepID=UPI00234F119D|nr:ionotropic receptor 25a-like [Mercenaria mercenaria]
MVTTTMLAFILVAAWAALSNVRGADIVTVLDKQVADLNRYLEIMLSVEKKPNMSLVISTENYTLETFESVCDEVRNGASILLDVSSPTVGPLLRSFARAHGLVFMTIMDESLVLPSDMDDAFFIQIQPPGSVMLKIIADIIAFDNLTNIAILYDNSFNLHNIPRRIVSGVLSHHIYLEIEDTGMTSMMNSIKELEIENVFIVASSTNAARVLAMGSQNLPLYKEMNWFVVTKDPSVKCLLCTKEMRVVLAGGYQTLQQKINYTNYLKSESMHFRDSEIRIDEAFAYDLMRIFKANLSLKRRAVEIDGCYGNKNITNETLRMNAGIMTNLSDVKHEGVFGPIVSTNGYIRQKIKMKLQKVIFRNGVLEELKSLGHWTEAQGLNLSNNLKSLIREKQKKTYRVVVIPDYEPFIYREKVFDNGTETRYEYKGLCVDLFKEIAERLDFDYDFYESEDGYFGSLNDDGTWNGAIHELIEKKADIAVGPISVMSERENVVDFTVPFHEPVGLTILMKKSKFEYTLHRFLSVLEPEVWGCIVASYFLFSVLMWLFDKFSPFSYQNNPDRGAGPEKRIFTLKEGIWFCMTSLTPQGGGEAPKAVSGRLVAATWWLYGFLLVAFYTANLAAFLTVTRLETPITSLEDLSKQQSVKYGPIKGTSALIYFNRMKEIEEQFYRIWKDMSLNDSLDAVARAKLAVWDYPVSEQFTKLISRMYNPNTTSEAMDMVRRGELALIDDRSRNRYQVLTDCNVEEIGEEFSRKPFAFAVTQGSPLRAQMSNVILELSNNRYLEDLTNKWWDSNELKKECDRIEDESDGISIENIGGVFLVIAIGTGMSLIAFVVEYYYYKIKPLKEERLYKMRGRTNVSRIRSEVSLDNVDVDRNTSRTPDCMNTMTLSTTRSDSSDSCVKFSSGNTASYRRSKKKVSNAHSTSSHCNGIANGINGRHNNNGDHRHSNGHVSNGVTNSIFTYDSDEDMSVKYPDLHDPERKSVFSEKL